MKTKVTVSKGVIFWLLYFSYVAIYMARQNLSMASPALQDAGLLTAAQLGFIGGAFSLIYSCGRLFNGILGDRIAPKVLIVVGLMFSGLANLFVGFLPPYILLLGLWCINAFAQSMLWSALVCTVSNLYDHSHAGQKVSILVSSVSMGNIACILATPWFIELLGVRFAFIIPGIMTALAALTVLYIVPGTAKGESKSHPFSFKALFTDRCILGTLLPAMFHGTMKDNIPLFMPLLFQSFFDLDVTAMAGYVLLVPVVGLVGRLLYPIFYKLSKNRENFVAVCCFVLCALLGSTLCIFELSPLSVAICLGAIYALVSMINTAFLSTLPLRFAAKGMVSSVSGILDFATYLGASIGSAIYGVLIDRGLAGYTYMFISWAVLSVVAIIILLFQHPFRVEEI